MIHPRRGRFVRAEAIRAAFADAPAINAVRFRTDVDSLLVDFNDGHGVPADRRPDPDSLADAPAE